MWSEQSERPWIALNLCIKRRYDLGQGDLVSTTTVFEYAAVASVQVLLSCYFLSRTSSHSSLASRGFFVFCSLLLAEIPRPLRLGPRNTINARWLVVGQALVSLSCTCHESRGG